ncbi:MULTISPECIES: hypothetical protein [Micromonospora]|uniref:NACHT domain-containing protein n=1 Tax=Micromonospora solifontis TaxID=2487138 RepID=A0ABX9WBC4_9ACTN|nr:MULTISPECIES: hypothetical protein [Micromonospora]NES12992.1 hypothetical protein [Micromonospora sp. PPF5-17B]NES38633.1 hypothetical protein [Micromonospora solifontis]NES54917.1 hypothetical protein [Micromonospora sp. PPF5-6]RNL94446.1 hypothetical protein EFE23_21160 [Micromonospora solifontis]
MRGPLWRGWLWTPRIWWARLSRRGQTTLGGGLRRVEVSRSARFPSKARGWHLPWPWLLVVLAAVTLFAIVTLTQFVLPLYHLVVHHWLNLKGPRLDWPKNWFNPCSDRSGEPHNDAKAACGSITGFFRPVAAAALTFVVFLIFIRFYVRSWYLRRARHAPRDLVQTANDDIDRVVGRTELCEVLIERIRDDEVRCPTVIVGGVGSGKTATLVQLTAELARRGVVPVPVRLHDVQDKDQLDFEDLAKKQFLAQVDSRLYSDAQGGRLWRMLRWQNRVTVLADGLEEAAKEDKTRSGESVLRAAIGKAAEACLPLVIASRPYDPLRGMPVIVVALEPLGEGAALEYALDTDQEWSNPAVWGPVIELVVAADVTESPLFLRIVRDLNRSGRLHHHIGSPAEPGLARRPTDRHATRWRLLQTWRDALVDGYLRADYAQDREQREDTLLVLSAFACAGFLDDTLQITYDTLTGKGRWSDPKSESRQRQLFKVLQRRLWDVRDPAKRRDPADRDELNRAATEGDELGVVDAQSDGVRFQHGDVQAYLGARLLADEPDLRRWLVPELIDRAPPSRETLTALRLLSRSDAGPDGHVEATERRLLGIVPVTGDTPGDSVDMVHRLRRRANDQMNGCWQLEFYAAAVEIDSNTRRPEHADLIRELSRRWRDYQHDVPDRPLDEAKLEVVRRIGDAARWLVDRRRFTREDLGDGAHPRYADFFRLAAQDHSYRVRLAAAREIGLGGWTAADDLDRADLLRPRVLDLRPGADAETHPNFLREQQLRGWVVPLLAISTRQDADADAHGAAAQQRGRLAWGPLGQWLDRLITDNGPPAGRRLGIASEMALAQGLRLAANVRRLPVGLPTWDRSAMVEKAEMALRRSRYWFSHLALLQALTLLSLPEDPLEPLPRRGHGANPYGLVQHWISIAGADLPGQGRCAAHPFVLEVGRLCTLTLLTRRPERYCWIDERETASRVGSCTTYPQVRRVQRFWIPDSMGWSVLDRRAQRLIADIMLLLNLADRGDGPAQREERLARADRCDLPPCLTNDRSPLQPSRTAHEGDHCEPGATCLDDCAFRLCPLPARGERMPHELDQNFCARQSDLAWYLVRARAPWQNCDRRSLRAFWRQMAERTLPDWRR